MGVPWQTDEASCRSGYAVGTYLPLPTFWAARVPNQTLSRESYERLFDDELSTAQRHKHFDQRQDWLRYFGPGYQTEINDMVQKWDKLGILAERPGPPDHERADLPSSIWIETGLDAEEFHTRTDPTWVQLLRAEKFGTDTTPSPFVSTANAADARASSRPPPGARPVGHAPRVCPADEVPSRRPRRPPLDESSSSSRIRFPSRPLDRRRVDRRRRCCAGVRPSVVVRHHVGDGHCVLRGARRRRRHVARDDAGRDDAGRDVG
jgi:hypothetical protein